MIRVSGMFQKDLKNRSSKHLKFMTGPGTKSVLRCVSGDQLKKWAANMVKGAQDEINRRAKKQEAK